MSGPSITCPKCRRPSFNESDIEFKYCGACGYHDAPEDAPLGVPGVSAKFRQPSPVMQLRAEYSSIEGNFSIWQDEIISDTKFTERLHRHLANVKEICEHMERTGRADSWEESSG
jgi:hypothetical protein